MLYRALLISGKRACDHPAFFMLFHDILATLFLSSILPEETTYILARVIVQMTSRGFHSLLSIYNCRYTAMHSRPSGLQPGIPNLYALKKSCSFDANIASPFCPCSLSFILRYFSILALSYRNSPSTLCFLLTRICMPFFRFSTNFSLVFSRFI